MLAFTIAAFGMCGAPPVAGFISKWHFCLGAIQSKQLFFLFIILVGSLLDVIYFFPVIRKAFFEKIPKIELYKEDIEEKVEVFGSEKLEVVETKRPLYLFMIIPLSITAIFSLILCLFPNTFHIYDLAQMAIKDIFGGM